MPWQEKVTKICPLLNQSLPGACRFGERAGWAGMMQHQTRVMLHPRLVMYALPSPSDSPNPPRLNKQMRPLCRIAWFWWASETAAEMGHEGAIPPMFHLPCLLASLKDYNSRPNPLRSFSTILLASYGHRTARSATGRFIGESYRQWLQAGYTLDQG